MTVQHLRTPLQLTRSQISFLQQLRFRNDVTRPCFLVPRMGDRWGLIVWTMMRHYAVHTGMTKRKNTIQPLMTHGLIEIGESQRLPGLYGDPEKYGAGSHLILDSLRYGYGSKVVITIRGRGLIE